MDRKLTSAQRLLKIQGALVAEPFYIKPTGYKARTSLGYRPKLQSETTNRAIQKQVREGSGTKKPLGPYSLTAPRNRPKETLTNMVGTRHKLHPCIMAERYRGSSKVQLVDGDPESKRKWRTTNQVFAACARVQDTIGLANPGISSDVAHTLHKQQGIYGK
ncbi:hypothetical protein WJX81_000588 [Elliptochloris bilobata]|uniref:HNH homing endonuclease n=1 Tax=Elliptochloris bilobata TaxID=381761 RepID=A0AAW1SGS9_9CHLO